MSDLDRARQWRKRAEELRTIAETMHVKDARDTLLGLADELDRMAERLEGRERASD